MPIDSKTGLDPESLTDNITMAENPDLWPHSTAFGGFLPLKRRPARAMGEGLENANLGVMVSRPGIPAGWVFLTFIMDKRLRNNEMIQTLPRKEYDSPREAILDGWWVD